MRYEIFKDADGFARWRVRGKNGEIVASSEAYAPRHPENGTFDAYEASRGLYALVRGIVNDEIVAITGALGATWDPGVVDEKGEVVAGCGFRPRD